MTNVSSSNGLEKQPKLRFPGFDEPWETESLDNLGTFVKGAPLSKADISLIGTPLILYGELYTTYSEVAYIINRKTDQTVDPVYYSRIGDVIIPTSGETAEDIATATCVMVPGVILAGDLNIFRTTKVDGRVVSYIIKNKVNRKISSLAQGKSVVHISAAELSKINISFPSETEQRKILELLKLLDDKIAKQSQLISILKKYT
ncbi:MAG: restriction endonuclease subunit S [Monoglobales bacterium]